MGTNTDRSNCRFLFLLLDTTQQACWRTSLLGSDDEGNTDLPEIQEFRSPRGHALPRDRDLLHSIGKTWVTSRK